jgi:cytochrome oxidase Cu insertion factor (SCO1/SenC/PrrC family)
LLPAVLALLIVSCSSEGMAPKVKVGDLAPKSQNRVLAPGVAQQQVSTLDSKAHLYDWRIADLVTAGRPFLVVFGTPQHCTMCVDQLRRVAVMQEKYGDRFAFVHVDGYKDTAVWVEWGIQGEPWTYVVDAKGRVRSVLPGQTELGLLEQEIERVLKEIG